MTTARSTLPAAKKAAGATKAVAPKKAAKVRTAKAVKLAYSFDHKHAKNPMTYKDLLGGKGANLAEMTSVLKLPVPPGFTISTDACRAYMVNGWPLGLDAEMKEQIAKVEKQMGKRLGDPDDPLLVSVRSGAKFSMPGMMDTVLNLGLNDRSVRGLARQTGDERFAYDSYRRFISMYGRIVMGVDGQLFEHAFEHSKQQSGAVGDNTIPASALKPLCEQFKAIIKEHAKKPFPQTPDAQLRGAVEAVFRSWNGARAIAYRVRERIPHDLGTAVNVQSMVFGNRNDNSGTGVGFTRNASNGENKPYGDYLRNAQGEDVVAGIRVTEDLDALAGAFPTCYAELMEIFHRLEAHYQDMCDTEFTIDDGKLWMLQTRVGKRTGAAALRMAVEMTSTTGKKGNTWKISKTEAVNRITGDHLDSVLHPQFSGTGTVITKGLGASPGAAVGKVYFTADDAVDATDRGEAVILVRNETSPEDVHGMMVAEGILTARGGLVSHAAVVARGWGKPAVVGADAISIKDDAQFCVGDIVVKQGETISLDGATGEVMLGALETASAEPPAEFHTLLGWADEIRLGSKRTRGLKVRANADNGPDAANARMFGAEGIGLCRTEHMFLGEDRLPIVRQMILAKTEDEEAKALETLRKAQKADFLEILEAMDGLPVCVRLLDPPLHEFLPSITELEVKAATTGLSPAEERLLGAAKEWHEVNPMLGCRGVRLGVVKPGLYAMQVRALMEAAKDRLEVGGKPVIEVMIPLTITRQEMALARSWVEEAVEDAKQGLTAKQKAALDVTIGTMIETPRAAVRSDEIAEVSDFFSYGTNDLTQMTLGFSRDDVAAKVIPAYLEEGLLQRDPFDTIDQSGVGDLVKISVQRGRSVKPNLKLGVCGEHGGEPESIKFLYEAGLDYVSCSPFRVPIARLAAGQAVAGAAAGGPAATA